MKEFKTYPLKDKEGPVVPATMSASMFREVTSAIAKQAGSVFPNGDPNFFTPSFRINDNKEQMANPYANNVWVYAAVSAITTNLIPLPKVLDVRNTPEKELIDENPILSLLENPNPLMEGATFWEHVILNLQLPTPKTKGGQCFIFAESLTERPVDLRRGEIPKELYPFSDEFITPIVDKSDGMTLLGWKFWPDEKKPPILYKPHEVIRIHLVDPIHPLRGQSPIWSARLGLRQDFKAQTLNERFFDNNASLGGVLESDAELQPEVGREIKESFEEKYSGQDNAGKIALLHSGVKYQMFQQSHKDMEFIEQRKWTREEILAAYGVPKFNIGVYEDINFATSKAADKSFWQNTLVPLDQRIMRAFTNQWVKFAEGGRFKLETDYSLVMALAQDFTEKLEQAKKLAELFVPVSEINERLELNLSIEQYPWLQTALVQGSLKPADQVMLEPEPDPVSDPEMEPTSAATPTEEEPELAEPVEAAMLNIGKLAKNAELIEQLKSAYLDQVLIPDEKKFHKVINNFLREQRNLILDEVDKWASANKSVKVIKADNQPDPIKLTSFKAAENIRLGKAVLPEYISMAEKEAEVLDIELTDGVGDWEVTSPQMKTVFRSRVKQIKSINTTTFNSARSAISKAIEKATKQGLGTAATAKLVKKEVNKVYTGRINSKTIATTESNSIHSQTRMNIYKTNGITKIKWQTADDKKVRNASDSDFPHTSLDQEVAKVDTGFNNGETIMYPLDPSASAGNVINCRCFVTSQA